MRRIIVPMLALVLFRCGGEVDGEMRDDDGIDFIDADSADVTGAGGLTGEYYSDLAMTQKVLTRIDKRVEFDWGTGAPAEGMPANDFAVRWRGSIVPRYTETYTVYTTSDDGVRLEIDGNVIVDDWSDHAARERSGTVSLVSGRRHAVTLTFYERGGHAVSKLAWSSARQAKTIIPSNRLIPAASEEPTNPNPPDPTNPNPPTTAFPAAPPSPGATYVVAPTGNDSGACNDAAPCKTIGGALAKINRNGGDKVLIKDGTYAENPWGPNVGLDGINGNANAWTTIAAYSGHKPKLFISGLSPNSHPTWQNISISNSSYIYIRGLEIAGDRQSVQGETNMIHLKDANFITIWENHIHDGAGGGISVERSDHLDIRGNRIHGNANWSCYGQSGISFNSLQVRPGGTDANGYGAKIIGNLIYDNEQFLPSTCIGQSYITDGNCIIMDLNNNSGYTSRTLVKNNICVSNGSRGLHALVSDHVDWIHNTTYYNMRTTDAQNSESGEITITWSADHAFEGNLIVPRTNRDPWRDWSDSSATMRFSNNLFVKTGFTAPNTGTGNVVVPTGTAVLTNPNQAANLGNWTPIGPAVGFGAPWPLSPQ